MTSAALDALAPTWLEIAAGRVVGESPVELEPLPESPLRDPIEAMERTMRGTLQRGPCVIGFTGGRDSSGLLGVAVRLARREGLPDPIPLTMRFPGIPSSDESAWQETMIKHLKVGDWERIDIDTAGGELDLLGDRAGRLFARRLLWPPNVLVLSRLFDAAAQLGARTVLTGMDADGLFGRWPYHRLGDVAGGRARPDRGDALRALRALGPRAIRREAAARSMWSPPWLRPGPLAQFRQLQAEETAGAPRRFDHWVQWWWRRRYVAMLKQGLDLAGGRDFAIHPYMEAGFVGALGRAGGPTGFGTRAAIMEALFTGILPPVVVGRRTKAATFSQLCWSRRTREFVAAWDGEGIDPEVADHDKLRATWLSPRPDERSALLVLVARQATATSGAAPVKLASSA